MRATAKYFFVVTALFFAQVLLGIVTAHYAVEGQGLYGLPMAEYFPVCGHAHLAHAARRAVDRDRLARRRASMSRRCWAAANRSSSGSASNFLFVSLLVIVVGSFAGEWLAINRHDRRRHA